MARYTTMMHLDGAHLEAGCGLFVSENVTTQAWETKLGK